MKNAHVRPENREKKIGKFFFTNEDDDNDGDEENVKGKTNHVEVAPRSIRR